MMGLETLQRYAPRALTAAFMFFALLTGGASLEGELAQAAFFAVSGVIAAALFVFAKPWWQGPVLTVFGLWIVLVLIVLLSLFPLPGSVWSRLPDRDVAQRGLEALGLSASGAPLSLAPETTLASLLAFLAPAAGFCLVAALKWSRCDGLLKWLIPACGALSALLGLAQVILGKSSGLYFYEFTAFGSPVGVFSNPNHQASFLLMGLPFVAVIASELRRDWEGRDEDVALALVAGVLGLLLIAGVLGAGSAAGYLLLAPVILLSAPLLLGGQRGSGGGMRGLLIVPAIFVFAGAVIFGSPRLSGLGFTSFEDGAMSRVGINRVSAEMLETHWLAGTGLGTYEDVFRLYEDPATVSQTYAAHAHNDYFEWLIETGLAGGLLLAAFLAWFLFHVGRLWTGSKSGALSLRRAASIACLVPILHSLVDYPLRTPGIAAIAAMCLALMIVPRARPEAPLPEAGEGASQPLRTVTI